MEPKRTNDTTQRPTIALAMGDPAGVSPELTAKLMCLDEIQEVANLVVFGDWRVLQEGASIAGVTVDADIVQAAEDIQVGSCPVFVDLGHLCPTEVRRGEATPVGGAFAMKNFNAALEMAGKGVAQAVCFTPFNKQAMRYVYPGYDDEIRFVAEKIGFRGPAREFNVLEGLWNARVTSHIPLQRVSFSITEEAILTELELTDRCLKEAGFANPCIAVAGLNPHGGDGGNFGREELDTIAPAVEKAKKRGMNVLGPYPADTVFVRAKNGTFDAVLTMYHDQGQIAMKLMGFDRGVTLLGGFPFPICTPAHGTAYDIAGKGIANVGASRQALLLAAKMATRRMHASATTEHTAVLS